jgi:hypothetical protein
MHVEYDGDVRTDPSGVTKRNVRTVVLCRTNRWICGSNRTRSWSKDVPWSTQLSETSTDWRDVLIVTASNRDRTDSTVRPVPLTFNDRRFVRWGTNVAKTVDTGYG